MVLIETKRLRENRRHCQKPFLVDAILPEKITLSMHLERFHLTMRCRVDVFFFVHLTHTFDHIKWFNDGNGPMLVQNK